MTVLIKCIGKQGNKACLNLDNINGFMDKGMDEILVTYSAGGQEVIRGDFGLLMDRLAMKLRHVDVGEYYRAVANPNPWATEIDPDGPAF